MRERACERLSRTHQTYVFTALHCPTTSDVLSARPYTAPPRTRSDTTRSVPVPLGAPSAGLAMSMRFAKAPDGKGYQPVLG